MSKYKVNIFWSQKLILLPQMHVVVEMFRITVPLRAYLALQKQFVVCLLDWQVSQPMVAETWDASFQLFLFQYHYPNSGYLPIPSTDPSLYSKCKICKPHCVEFIGIVVMYRNMRPDVAVVDTDWACLIGASLAETSSVHLSSSHISFAKIV